MAERELERKETSEKMKEEEKTSEVWVTDKEERMEKASGDIQEYGGNIIVNPPDAGGKLLKNSVGARNHNPGFDTGPTYSMDTVRKAAEVVNKGQERFNVKWPKE